MEPACTQTAVDGGDYPDRPHLRDSRQIDWSRVTRSTAALGVTAELLTELDNQAVRQRARKPDDRRRIETTLTAMTLDLFVAAEQPRRPWLAVSRRREDYTTALTRYVLPDVTYKASIEAANFLVSQGYAEIKPGSYVRFDPEDWSGGFGYRTRLRATDKLTDLFRAQGVTRDDIEDGGTTEIIRLKGSAEGSRGLKPLLPYSDTDDTHRMRRELRAWMELARQFDIRAADQRESGDDAELEEAGELEEYADPAVPTLYRVFNDGSWARGGRFYGGWWQSMPKARRATITVDGEPTVELDFKSFHPRLLYHLSYRPLEPDVDPYRLGGRWRDVDRDVVKVAFNQLLAINGEGRPKKPSTAVLPSAVTYKSLIEEIETRHRPVADWLRRGLAPRLQNIDSQIAERVMSVFTRELQRPILPVHDSFVVAVSDEAMLGYTMSMAYRDVLERLTKIEANPIIAGWSDDSVAAKVATMIEDDDSL